MRTLEEMCSGVKVILVDGGYRGELIGIIKKKFGYVIQVVISTYKQQGFRHIQKRWIVERSFFCRMVESLKFVIGIWMILVWKVKEKLLCPSFGVYLKVIIRT